jgi:hypothetical protein
LEEHTSYRSSDLKNCSEAYCTLAELILKSNMQEIVEKFRRPEHLEVLRIVKRVFTKQASNVQRGSSQTKQMAPKSGESLKQISGNKSSGDASSGKNSAVITSSFSKNAQVLGHHSNAPSITN